MKTQAVITITVEGDKLDIATTFTPEVKSGEPHLAADIAMIGLEEISKALVMNQGLDEE